jgi:hypothetical protein
MSATKFTISRKDVENSLESFPYSPYELYTTIRISPEGEETFNGDISGYTIMNGYADGIPSYEYDDWRNAVEEYLYNHDVKVESGEGFDVKFNITAVDSRAAYTYEEIVNGKVVKSGTGWSDEFETDVEQDAWIDAVVAFNKKIGKKMPTDWIKDKLDKLSAAVDSLDTELPDQMEFDIPMITTAIPELNTDVCQFVSDVQQAAVSAVATIGGLPTPKDVINYNIKVVKNNICRQVTSMYDAQTAPVKASSEIFKQEIEDDYDYWHELNAYADEIAKQEGQSKVYFDTVIEPDPEFQPIEFSYSNSEPPDGDYDYLPGNQGVYDYGNVSEKKDAVRKYVSEILGLNGKSINNLPYNTDAYVDECLKVGFDIPLLLAQAQQESHFGTTDRAIRTNNIFSVGLYDNGQNRYTYTNMAQCIAPYIQLVQKNYLLNGQKSVDQLLQNYVNYAGNRYASDRGYEVALKSIRNRIMSKYPVLRSEYSTPVDFSSLEYKEVSFANIYDPKSKWGPSNAARAHVAEAMKNLWVPLRKAWDQYARNLGIDPTWIITSGYRPVGCPLNGGTQKQTGSAHIVGYAIDVQPRFNGTADKRDKVKKLAGFLKGYLAQTRSLNFDQVLVEYSGGTPQTTSSMWCHIGYKNQQGSQRREFWPAFNALASTGNHGPRELI